MSTLKLLFCCILIAGTLLSCKDDNYQVNNHERKDRPDLAIEHDIEMTKDPLLNRPAPERMMKTLKVLMKNENRFKSKSNQIIWEERGPNNVSGRTRSFLIDANDASGNTVWAGGISGGLWKTTNFHSTQYDWNSTNDFFSNLAVSSIVQNPNNPNIIYFATGEGWSNADAVRGLGIWKSTNGGVTWSHLPSTNNSAFYYVQKLLIDDIGNVFACTKSEGLLRSSNGGLSWVKILGNLIGGGISNRAADIEMAINGDLYASLGIFSTDGMYKSTDSGNNWQLLNSSDINNGLPYDGYQRIEIACDPSNAQRLIALFQGTEDRECIGIYKTEDGANSWVSLAVPQAVGMDNFARNQAWYDLIAFIDPINPNRFLIGGVDLIATNNAGLNWAQVSRWVQTTEFPYVHADQHAIEYFPHNKQTGIVSNDGGVYYYDFTDGDPSFLAKINGYNITQFYSCAIHPMKNLDYMLGGTQDNGTQQFVSSGLNNTTEITGGDGGFCFIDQDDPHIQISTITYNKFHITNDYWSSNVRINIGDNTGRFINPMDYDSDSNTLFSAYNEGYLCRIRRVGGNELIDSIQIPGLDSAIISLVKVDPFDSDKIWLGTKAIYRKINGKYASKLFLIQDASSSSPSVEKTILIEKEKNAYLRTMDVSNVDPDRLVLAYSNYGIQNIFESDDRGDSWRSVEGNLPDMPVRWVMWDPHNENGILIGTELGVWRTQKLNGDNTIWEVINEGLANVRTDMLKFRVSDYTLVAATHGRGIFTTKYENTDSETFCDEIVQLESCEGSIQDGSDNENYGNNSNCMWLINPPGANTIVLNFDFFDIEEGFDFIRVFDGSSTSDPLLGTFSGKSLPPQITSTGGTILIQFESDSAVNGQGWSLNYQCCSSNIASVSIEGNEAVCEGSNQTYLISALEDANNYTWNLPSGWSGNSSTNSIEVTSGDEGGIISVYANLECGEFLLDEILVTVLPLPAKPSAIVGEPEVCQGDIFIYSIEPIKNASSYIWNLPSGWTGNSTSNSILATAGSESGLITVAGINNCGEGISKTLAVDVANQLLQPSPIQGETELCVGSVKLYTIPSVEGADSYIWTLPNDWSGQSNSRSIIVTIGSSSGQISVSALNECGLSATRILNVEVGAYLSMPQSIMGESEVCPATTYIYSIPEVEGADSYEWTLSFGWSGTSNDRSIIVTTGPNNGVISVKAINACEVSPSQTKVVFVTQINDSIEYTDDEISAVVENADYQWINCDNLENIEGEVGQSFSPNNSGNYAVIIYQSGCADTSNCFEFVVTANENIDLDKIVEIYPNPAKDYFFIEGDFIGYKFFLLSTDMKLVKTHIIEKGLERIDISNLSPGIYLYQIVNSKGGNSKNGKIMIMD